MTIQYGGFAYLYDRLMEDVDYEEWTKYIEEIIQKNLKGSIKILDLACGTGNITIPLAQRGYDVIGVDLSESMLMVAKDKAVENNLEILLIQQDMIDLEFDEKFNCILSMCDGINYILDEADLEKTFQRVYDTLHDGGIFLFDISTAYKLRNILGNNTFGENLGDICYLWENYFNEEEKIIEMDLTFFIQEGQIYRKEEEYHIQRAYEEKEILELLKRAGFRHIEIYDAFSFNLPTAKSERIFFLGKK